MSLSTSYRLEQEILTRFPTEKLEYYRTGKRGKIYSKFCNAKNSFKSIKRPSCSSVYVDGSRKGIARLFSPENDAGDCIRSLKFDNLSASEFDNSWQACSQYRLNEIINKTSSLTEIFNKWPEYKKPSGFRLIDKDFRVIFGSRSGVLGEWEEHFKLIKEFLCKDNHINDKAIKELLATLDGLDANNDAAAVKLLWSSHAYLVPTQKLITKDNSGKKQVVKFTIKSSQEAYIYVANNVQETEEHLRFLKQKSQNIQTL